ncbi:uncharacterized protein LOC117733072 [Cyclopterus lumpus]|uniref:uncharacterized protein LOC117733072 n=1 Tax=Cyclopterus lumpus TaxID=8103 RepID=UPI0014872808|nr:uncharacterized protein LOC117733072 [Cyclopterus lumpus]XP_034392310.1 uncharacterized protein LOC117733072 [Cyclopterus lumpus]
MSDVIEEAEDRALRREAQALVRKAREQQRAENTGPAATSSTPSGGSGPSCRRPVSLGATSATSSGLSIPHPAPSPLVPPTVPGCLLRDTPPSPVSWSAHTYFAFGFTHKSECSMYFSIVIIKYDYYFRAFNIGIGTWPPKTFLSLSLVPNCRELIIQLLVCGPTTSTGHTPEDMETVWECGRCREADPPESSEGGCRGSSVTEGRGAG